MAEIPFWVYDRPKWVSGITPLTSCADILSSLSTCLQDTDDSKRLILTEKWRDVEKPLSAEAKILHIWNAWGDEKKFVKFVVKRVSSRSTNHRKRLRRRGSVSSVDELHPKAWQHDQSQQQQQKDVIEEMMKIIEMQRKVITDELMKAKKKAKSRQHQDSDTSELKVILDEMLKLSQINDKLQFAEESVDRLNIALKHQQQQNSSENDQELVNDHLSCAKKEVSRLRCANDQAAIEVKDNQTALDKMEEAKAERKLALKRLEYDVNVIEKEGRKLAKEYEKVLNINLDDLVEITEIAEIPEADDEEDNEEIYALLNSSVASSSTTSKTPEENNSTTSGHSSTEDQSMIHEIIAKDSPIDDKNVNSSHQGAADNNSDTGLSSLHTSSDEGTYEVGTLV